MLRNNPPRRSHLTLFFILVACAALSAVAGRPAPSSAAAPKPAAAPRATTISLADFGAAADGATDDAPALQAALDALAAAGGGTLFVPAGRYALRTPVSKNFAPGVSVTISGVVSPRPIDVRGNGSGLSLTSEFLVRVGEAHVALNLSGAAAVLVHDLIFSGDPAVKTDAHVTLDFVDVGEAVVRHSEFYGVVSLKGGGAVVKATRSRLTIDKTAFLGCTGDSGRRTPVVQNVEWLAGSLTDTKFIDYGERPGFFSKTPLAAPFSWVNFGNAAPVTAADPRREIRVSNVFLDEGGYYGLTSMPDHFTPPGPTPDLIHVSGLRMNVTNLGSSGFHFSRAHRVLVERSFFGWSHNADKAIELVNVGAGILDLVECDLDTDADTIAADYQTGRLSVINSIYRHLITPPAVTRVFTTATPDEDPAQHVRQKYLDVLGRAPDPAGHFYWTDRMLRCDADAACEAAARTALADYLASSPATTFALGGRVTDEGGAGVGGVRVVLGGSASVETLTAADGSYAFANLPTAGAYTLAPSKAYYTFPGGPASVTAPVGDRSVNFAAARNRHYVAGRVTDTAGRGVQGATVTLSGDEDRTATTDQTGFYVIDGIAAGGDYRIAATSRFHTFNPIPQAHNLNDLAADTWAEFYGALNRHRIAGRVTKADGSAMAGLGVLLSGSQDEAAITDAGGRYSFTVTAAGIYTVRPASAPRFHTFAPQPAVTYTHIDGDRTADFAAVLSRHSVAGRVTSGGVAVAGATVTLSGARQAVTTTNSAGAYSFANLPAGSNYTVVAARSQHEFAPPARSFAPLEADQTAADFATTAYAITGRVAEGGAGVPGVTMTLAGAQSATATTAADGSYSFTVRGGGNYTVAASKPHHTFRPPARSLAGVVGNRTADFAAAVNRHSVAGRVATADGGPVAGATLALSGAASGAVTTDAAGNYAVNNLAAGGNYTLTVSKAGYTFAQPARDFTNLVSNQTADFTGVLARYQIGGRVTDESGEGVARVSVQLGGASSATTQTDSAGNYSFRDLPGARDYTVKPQSAVHDFTPLNAAFTNLGANQTANFVAAPSPSARAELVWVDDALPPGATPAGDGEGWTWADSNPAPFSGTAAHRSGLVAGMHQHYFTGASQAVEVGAGDTLFAYVYLDPANPPSQVMLQWNAGGDDWEHRAYWGADSLPWGANDTASRRRVGDLPAAGGWVRLEVSAASVGLEGRSLNGMAFTLFGGQAAWDRAGKVSAPPPPNDVVWVEDDLPQGATANVYGDGEPWQWSASTPLPFSGSLAHHSAPAAGLRQHYFTGAAQPLAIAAGDKLFAYVYLDPSDLPSEIMLQWNAEGDDWEHRAYWGANMIGWGADGTAGLRRAGDLPAAGGWVRLEVPASAVGLEGKAVTGMAFTLFGGRAAWDRAGKAPAAPPPAP